MRGRVQGVYYRASTRDQANQLGVVGHARNLPDGTVEVFAAGAADSVEQLIAWLGQGPPAARVDTVEVVEVALDALPEKFVVR